MISPRATSALQNVFIYRGVILNKFFKVIDGTHHRGGPCDHLVTSYLIIV